MTRLHDLLAAASILVGVAQVRGWYRWRPRRRPPVAVRTPTEAEVDAELRRIETIAGIARTYAVAAARISVPRSDSGLAEVYWPKDRHGWRS